MSESISKCLNSIRLGALGSLFQCPTTFCWRIFSCYLTWHNCVTSTDTIPRCCLIYKYNIFIFLYYFYIIFYIYFIFYIIFLYYLIYKYKSFYIFLHSISILFVFLILIDVLIWYICWIEYGVERKKSNNELFLSEE